MSEQEYETQKITWRGIAILVSYNPKRFESANIAHITLNCDEPLPITETGYRSIFSPNKEIPNLSVAVTEVLELLEKSAKKSGWQPNNQLSLF